MTWVKLMCNVLDNRKIKIVRDCPEGNTLVLLWIMMLVEAGKCNRGGYLMVSDRRPYTAQTLGMVTAIPLPTVQFGLSTFTELDMIDGQDGMIFIKNWSKYQSEEKLELRRESDRLRQQRHRHSEREKLLAAKNASTGTTSRDSHALESRDVTQENRADEDRKDTTTTTNVVDRLLAHLPPEAKYDGEIRDWLAEAAAIHGEEYVASNVSATTGQAKTNWKGFLRKALQKDFGEIYRARSKMNLEKNRLLEAVVVNVAKKDEFEESKLEEATALFNCLQAEVKTALLSHASDISPFKSGKGLEAAAINILIDNDMQVPLHIKKEVVNVL